MHKGMIQRKYIFSKDNQKVENARTKVVDELTKMSLMGSVTYMRLITTVSFRSRYYQANKYFSMTC